MVIVICVVAVVVLTVLVTWGIRSRGGSSRGPR